MKLYDWKVAPNPRRVRVFMAEKGIDIPLEESGDEAEPALSKDFLSKHANGTVPVLELDDGTCISEAPAICRYLESLYPEPPLMGINPLDTALIEMWERRAELICMQGIANMLRNAHPAFADRGLPGISEPVPQIPELVERGKIMVSKFLSLVEPQLADNEFIAGPRYSVADITAMCALDFAKVLKFEIPEACTNTARWYGEVKARPSSAFQA